MCNSFGLVLADFRVQRTVNVHKFNIFISFSEELIAVWSENLPGSSAALVTWTSFTEAGARCRAVSRAWGHQQSPCPLTFTVWSLFLSSLHRNPRATEETQACLWQLLSGSVAVVLTTTAFLQVQQMKQFPCSSSHHSSKAHPEWRRWSLRVSFLLMEHINQQALLIPAVPSPHVVGQQAVLLSEQGGQVKLCFLVPPTEERQLVGWGTTTYPWSTLWAN